MAIAPFWTTVNFDRLRRDLAADAVKLPDTQADAVFTEAAADYDTQAEVIAAARVILLRGWLAESAPLTSYRENASSEEASDRFEHYQKLLDYWERLLARAQAAAVEIDTQARQQSAHMPTIVLW